jgi:hypothetical protein
VGRTPHPDHYGGVAQLEERPTLTRQVLGSNPSSSANSHLPIHKRGARNGYGPVCKTWHAGSIPVHASNSPVP